MSFAPLTPHKKWSGALAPVRAGLVMMRGSHMARLWIVLAPRVLREIGAEAHTHLGADIGEGPDEGYVRLRPLGEGEAGFKLAKLPAGESVRIVLGHIPSLPNEKHEMRDAAYEVRDGAVIVTLPAFARRAGAAPPPAAASKQPQAAAPTAPTTAPPSTLKTAAASPAIASRTVAPRLSIEDAVFTTLSVKAGIAFGCTRVEALNPQEDHHWDAFNAIARWMSDSGYAAALIMRKLKIGSDDLLNEALAAPVDHARLLRFRTLVADGLKLAGSAA